MENGANPAAKDRNGPSPVDVAREGAAEDPSRETGSDLWWVRRKVESQLARAYELARLADLESR